MRKIIQQMLKGEQVAFCESVQTELKALAAKKEKALASLQELFAESEKKKFDEIVEGWDKASAVAFEDYYGAGFVFGAQNIRENEKMSERFRGEKRGAF